MISLYRWQPGQKHGDWVDLPELPANGAKLPEGEVWWLDVENPSEEEEARVFQRFLPVHPLTLEDITLPRRDPDRAPHLPKVEEFPDYLFVIATPLKPGADVPPTSHVGRLSRMVVQLSAVLTHQVLITHHYLALPTVTEAKQFLCRHCEQAGRGPDYLFHLVLDRIVDEYAPEIDRIVERLDDIEEKVLATASQQLLTELIHLKRRVIALRKTLILMREVLARLTRGEFELVDVREIAYYRNVYDHLVRYTELIEGAREMVSDLMQMHLAATSNKLNGIMKTLAMVSTVILPMSLIASIYGMNFKKNMPELEWDYGYPFALGLMFVVAGIAVWLFYRMKWL
ncbi:MAG TPA: magnesium/cobalt transporter CorA [Gemmataceae bacterium]|nr:magnesium/cobalt transporter CorA [Gemmataceae bacterium]